MKIELWWIGKCNESYIDKGISIYKKRIPHYNPLSIIEFKDIKTQTNPTNLSKKEGEVFLNKLKPTDWVILLDEKGDTYTSRKFSKMLESWLSKYGPSKIVFIIAGAFGASDELKERANHSLSLSEMTFSHQMIRLFFLEQLYRAFTILRNEKYHND